MFKISIENYLNEFSSFSREEIFEQRKKKFLDIGKQKSFTEFLKTEGNIANKKNIKPKHIIFVLGLIVVLALLIKFL